MLGFDGTAQPVKRNATKIVINVFIVLLQHILSESKPDKYAYQVKGAIMFLTIGLIVGFAAGWFANEKWDDLKSVSKKAMFWKK